jgi:hypothetical protein
MWEIQNAIESLQSSLNNPGAVPLPKLREEAKRYSQACTEMNAELSMLVRLIGQGAIERVFQRIDSEPRLFDRLNQLRFPRCEQWLEQAQTLGIFTPPLDLEMASLLRKLLIDHGHFAEAARQKRNASSETWSEQEPAGPRLSSLSITPPPLREAIRFDAPLPPETPPPPRKLPPFRPESDQSPRKRSEGMTIALIGIGAALMFLTILALEAILQSGLAQKLGIAVSHDRERATVVENQLESMRFLKQQEEKNATEFRIDATQRIARLEEQNRELKKNLDAQSFAREQLETQAAQLRAEKQTLEKETGKLLVDLELLKSMPKESSKIESFTKEPQSSNRLLISFHDQMKTNFREAIKKCPVGESIKLDLGFIAEKLQSVGFSQEMVDVVPRTAFGLGNELHFDYRPLQREILNKPELQKHFPEIIEANFISSLIRVQIVGQSLQWTPHRHFSSLPETEQNRFLNAVEGFLLRVQKRTTSDSCFVYLPATTQATKDYRESTSKSDNFVRLDPYNLDRATFKLQPEAIHRLTIDLSEELRNHPIASQVPLSDLWVSVWPIPTTSLGEITQTDEKCKLNSLATLKAKNGSVTWQISLPSNKSNGATNLLVEFHLKRSQISIEGLRPEKGTPRESEQQLQKLRLDRLREIGYPELDLSTKTLKLTFWVKPDPGKDIFVPLTEISLSAKEKPKIVGPAVKIE